MEWDRMQDVPGISYHAMARYLERFCDVNFDDVVAKAANEGIELVGDKDKLFYLQDAGKINIETLRKKLCTPELRDAILKGARRVKIGQAIFVCEDRCIVTINRTNSRFGRPLRAAAVDRKRSHGSFTRREMRRGKKQILQKLCEEFEDDELSFSHGKKIIY